MKARKLLATILALAMTLSMLSVGALAAETENEKNGVMPISDTEQTAPVSTLPADAAASWAADSIERWNNVGIVKGDDNGNFNPDASLSRAELAQIFVNMFGLTVKADNTFGDLKSDAWYADAILKCVAAGIMKGDGVNANAEAKISRQETIVMFGRAVGVTPDAKPDLSKFTDASSVADWAAGYMAPLTKMGILSGGGDGTINAGGQIDRASTMALMDKAVAEYVNAPGEYKVDDTNKFVVVNMSAKEGEIVISGATAGVTVSAGTAEGKIIAKDLKTDTIKVDGTAALNVEGKSSVGEVVANNTGAVTVAKGVTVDTVTANAAGTITNNGTIKELTANAATKVDNKGTITKADVKADGVVLGGTKPKEVAVDEGTKNPTNEKGEDIPATPDKPNNGGNSGNGGGNVPDSSISVATLPALKDALANSQYSTITLTANIDTAETIVINRAVTIDGGNFKITGTITGSDATRKSTVLIGDGSTVLTGAVTLKNLKVVGPDTNKGNTWDNGEYGIKAYCASNVTLNNVTVTEANAGIQVNSSTVTLTGTVDVSNNGFGGIEVAQGEGVATKGTLTVTGALVNTTETTSKPTVWIENDSEGNAKGTVTGSMLHEETVGNKVYYYLSTHVDTLDELKTALTNPDYSIITLAGNIDTAETVIINRAVTIDGRNFTITGKDLTGADATRMSTLLIGDGVAALTGKVVIEDLKVVGPNSTANWDSGEYGIKVFRANDVELNGVSVTNANAGIQVNSSKLTLKGEIALDNEKGGIEVAQGLDKFGLGQLVIDAGATLTNTESATNPTVWIENDAEGAAMGTIVGGSLSKLAIIENEKTVKNYYFLDATKSGAEAMVDGVLNMSFTDTLKTLASGKTVTLLKDIVVMPNDLTGAWNRENMALALVIDLNENTLTVAGKGSVFVGYNDTNDTSGGKTADVQKGLELDITIKNGTISASNTQNAKANFIVEKGQKLTLDGVNGMTVNASGSAFLVRGDGATLNIKKSTVTAAGVYAISTNAADAVNYDVVINVTDDSTLETTASDSDACALMINVPGTLNVKDSTINGQRQAVIVRAGTAVFDGVTINAAPVKLGDGEHKYAANPAAWADGNRVAYSGVVVGGHKDNTYKADADVTLKDCTINLVNDSNLEAVTCGAVYVAAPGSTYSSLVTVSGTTTITGPVVKYTGNTVEIAGYEGVVTVLPEVVE